MESENVTVASLQTSFTTDTQANVNKITELVREAHQREAQVILLPELFENVYFCKVEDERFFALARPVKDHPTLSHFQRLARELSVVIPVSFFEKDGPHY